VKIFITLSTTLRGRVPDYDPEQGLTLEADGPATVRTLAETLGLPLKEVKVVMLNGRHADLEDPVTDGDQVALFPAVGGG
jgi:molybdopterin converting factor small subunit